MAKLTVIFTRGNNLLSDLISRVTDGPYTHVAVKILGSVLEAFITPLEGDKYPGVWLHEPDRYDHYQSAVFIAVEVPDLRAAEREARRLLGTFYGYQDCLNAGIYQLTDVSLPGNGKRTMHCSEVVTRILRAGGLTILPGVNADSVSPMNLYRALQNLEFF